MATFTTYADAAQQQSNQASAAATLGNGHHLVASTSTLTTSGTEASSASAVAVSSSSQSNKDDEGELGGKKKKARRRKVNHACLYCRRSHMTCDEGRPCQRCIKREIGHLCHDEQRTKAAEGKQPHPGQQQQTPDTSRAYPGGTSYTAPCVATSTPAWPMTGPFLYQPETLGNEFSVLTDFLETLDERSFFTPPPTVTSSLLAAPNTFPPPAPPPPAPPLPESFTNGSSSTPSVPRGGPLDAATSPISSQTPGQAAEGPDGSGAAVGAGEKTSEGEDNVSPVLPAATKTEKFLLTAADQESGSRDERLNRVIRSKYEAGLLKPYNYVKGYARLSRWMDRNVSQESKSQILQPLSVLRPKFRAIAQSLRDIDLVFIEEAFERMLLDYDRVFSAMGVPACLWRRTGEIYKANREFAELVGIDGFMMRDGRLCIYELMAEESAVNYWEKYGHVAFDSSQKAVLTSCVLRYKPIISSSGGMSTPIAKGSAAAASASLYNANNANYHANNHSNNHFTSNNANNNGAIAASNGHGNNGTGPHFGSGNNSNGNNGSGNGNAITVVKKEEEEEDEEEVPMEEGFINCCFSFTIRRDKWGIPSMIVGNFIKC